MTAQKDPPKLSKEEIANGAAKAAAQPAPTDPVEILEHKLSSAEHRIAKLENEHGELKRRVHALFDMMGAKAPR